MALYTSCTVTTQSWLLLELHLLFCAVAKYKPTTNVTSYLMFLDTSMTSVNIMSDAAPAENNTDNTKSSFYSFNSKLWSTNSNWGQWLTWSAAFGHWIYNETVCSLLQLLLLLSLDLNEARDDAVLRWQWHQLDHMQSVPCSRQITTPTPHHSIFIGRMLFLMPKQQYMSGWADISEIYCSSRCSCAHIEPSEGEINWTW